MSTTRYLPPFKYINCRSQPTRICSYMGTRSCHFDYFSQSVTYFAANRSFCVPVSRMTSPRVLLSCNTRGDVMTCTTGPVPNCPPVNGASIHRVELDDHDVCSAGWHFGHLRNCMVISRTCRGILSRAYCRCRPLRRLKSTSYDPPSVLLTSRWGIGTTKAIIWRREEYTIRVEKWTTDFDRR